MRVLTHHPLGAELDIISMCWDKSALQQRALDAGCGQGLNHFDAERCVQDIVAQHLLRGAAAHLPAPLPAALALDGACAPVHVEHAVAGPGVAAVSDFFMDKAAKGKGDVAVHPFVIQQAVHPRGDAAALAVKDQPEAGRFDHGVFVEIFVEAIAHQLAARHDGVAKGRHFGGGDDGAGLCRRLLVERLGDGVGCGAKLAVLELAACRAVVGRAALGEHPVGERGGESARPG